MLYLLDTNVISDLVRDVPTVKSRLAQVSAADRVVTSTVVVGEWAFGLLKMPAGRRRDELRLKTAAVLPRFFTEPVPALAADWYASTKLARQLQGRPVDENDLWIAATALALGAVLVSRDGDVQGIPGLTVEDWSI
jgi:predicted nucleic acid-binding protein